KRIQVRQHCKISNRMAVSWTYEFLKSLRGGKPWFPLKKKKKKKKKEIVNNIVNKNHYNKNIQNAADKQKLEEEVNRDLEELQVYTKEELHEEKHEDEDVDNGDVDAS